MVAAMAVYCSLVAVSAGFCDCISWDQGVLIRFLGLGFKALVCCGGRSGGVPLTGGG